MPSCVLCDQRPPRRHCPALKADICAPCCGEARERTIQCPFDCEYLLQARQREPAFELPAGLPNQDLDPHEQFLRSHEPLLLTMVGMLFVAAVKTEASDLDLREAVACMIRERRGLKAEWTGEVAQAFARQFQQRFDEFSGHVVGQAEGKAMFQDADVLLILVFFQREEMHYNNRRPKSRAYIDWLRGWMSQMAAGMNPET